MGGSSRNAWRIGKPSLQRNPPNLLNLNLLPIEENSMAEKLPGLLGPGFVFARMGNTEKPEVNSASAMQCNLNAIALIMMCAIVHPYIR